MECIVDIWLHSILMYRWLYKLGLAARMGHSVVCHQSLFSSDRGLVDPTDFAPMPVRKQSPVELLLELYHVVNLNRPIL